jgi:hypothetical protein
MRRLVCTISAVFLFVACADSPTALQDDLVGPQFGKAMAHGQASYTLTGRTTFGGYNSVSGVVRVPPDQNFLLAEATLTVDGKEVVLTMTEFFPTDPPSPLRTLNWLGTLTPGGVLKLEPEGADAEIAGIEEHTGCTDSGTLLVYHGRFDGQSLYAATHFHGLCDGGTMWGPVFGVSEDQGPLHVTFTIELEVVD